MLPLPRGRATDPAILQEIDELLDQHTDKEIAALLNQRGRCSFDGKPFTRLLVRGLRRSRTLEDRCSRLRATGLLTRQELMAQLGVSRRTLIEWRRRGLPRAYPYNDQGSCLYEPPNPSSL